MYQQLLNTILVKTRRVSAINMATISGKALCFHVWLRLHINKLMYTQHIGGSISYTIVCKCVPYVAVNYLQLAVLTVFILTVFNFRLLYCNEFAGSISQWKFITFKIQYTTVNYNQ
jgi:hypothetical protein